MHAAPLKIGIVCAKYGTTGGTEILAQRIAEYTAAHSEFEVHVLSNNRRPPAAPGITHHYLSRALIPHTLRKTLFGFQAARRARHLGLDLVHTFGGCPGAQVVTIGTPHLFWLRDVLGLRRYSVKDRLTVFIEQRTLRSPLCRRILAVSELARAQHSRYYPELASKVEVREPGFNSAVFARSDAAELRSEVRRELGFSADEFVGVFVGNNFELKGLTHVLAALSERRRLGKETKLIVIGRGDLARFQREINERGLESDVRLLGPVTSGVERYYFAGDFFILLSAIETYCIAVLEALGAKLPVIITRGMGVTPVVERGECGIVVDDPADTTAVLRALGQLESAEVRRTLGERGRTLSQERDWKNLCQGMVELYRAELHRVGLHRVELHRDELT